jgi:NADH dehydrogenase
MAGTDAVIHLVGIISEVGQSTFESVHTRGTQNVLAAAKMGGVRRFVHMSALGTRPNPIARYHQSKWAAEASVRGSGLDFTIFRPSLIYGPHDHFVNLFAKFIRRSPILPIMGSGTSRFQPVYIGSVARAFVTALISPDAIGQTYDLCGPERFTLGEMLDQILGVMGRKRWKVRVPLGLARLQASLVEFIFSRLLRKAPPLNRDQLTMLQEDNVGNGQPANELFGLKQVKFAEAIASYLRPGA